MLGGHLYLASLRKCPCLFPGHRFWSRISTVQRCLLTFLRLTNRAVVSCWTGKLQVTTALVYQPVSHFLKTTV